MATAELSILWCDVTNEGEMEKVRSRLIALHMEYHVNFPTGLKPLERWRVLERPAFGFRFGLFLFLEPADDCGLEKIKQKLESCAWARKMVRTHFS